MKSIGLSFAKFIANLASDKKASDILILDLRKIDYITDFFVILSGNSSTQVKAIADYIDEKLGEEKVYPFHKEEDVGSSWILLDYIDVIVHVFEENTRKFYALERLWGDAKFIKLKDKHEKKYKKLSKRRDKK
ncbi:MAG: ribosome silencing factor [Candidatus Firestonebacteria bacterium]